MLTRKEELARLVESVPPGDFDMMCYGANQCRGCVAEYARRSTAFRAAGLILPSLDTLLNTLDIYGGGGRAPDIFAEAVAVPLAAWLGVDRYACKALCRVAPVTDPTEPHVELTKFGITSKFTPNATWDPKTAAQAVRDLPELIVHG